MAFSHRTDALTDLTSGVAGLWRATTPLNGQILPLEATVTSTHRAAISRPQDPSTALESRHSSPNGLLSPYRFTS
jgi:hypothetical protein